MTMPCQKRRPGFTLLELVVVIAIIAILAVIALPSFFGKAARKQIIDSIPLMDLAKAGVERYYRANRDLPADNAAAGLPPADRISGNYVAAVNVKDGAVTMTFGNKVSPKLAGKKLSIRAAIDKQYPEVPVMWVCNTRPVPAGKTVGGTNETSIETEALPLECR